MSKRKGYTTKIKRKTGLRWSLVIMMIIIVGIGYLIQHEALDEPSISESWLDTTSTVSPTSVPRDQEVTKVPKSSESSESKVSELTVHFIDVGQADSILICSDGEFMLVDAGNNADKDTVINYLKDQGVKELKYVVATHPHEDHIGAMDEVIEEFPVGKVFAPYVEHTSKTYYNLLEAVSLANLKMKQPKVGSEIKLGGSVITFLAPNSDYGDDLNNWSIGLKVTNGVHTFVMCGDAESLAESDILANGIDLSADVLKLGHHGSSTASSEAFLKAVNPQYAVISCGVDNSYGHPHVETLQKLNQLNISFFRTDLQKTIVATSDGKKLTWNVKACD